MNKKYFLGSLLMLALCVTGCNTTTNTEGGETSNESSNNGTSENSNQSTNSSESSNPIPAPAAGAFAFSDTELNTPQEIHTADQKAYLSFNKEYYTIKPSDLSGFHAEGNKDVSTPLPVKLNWNFTAPEGKTVSKYSVFYGQKADLSDAFEVVGTNAKSVSFYNPF